jgi:hypothetical protein
MVGVNMLSVMLFIVILSVFYAGCPYAEWHVLIVILRVIMLGVNMLSVMFLLLY